MPLDPARRLYDVPLATLPNESLGSVLAAPVRIWVNGAALNLVVVTEAVQFDSEKV